MYRLNNLSLRTEETSCLRNVLRGLCLIFSLFLVQSFIVSPVQGSSLSIETTPEGLSVLLDGRPVGEAPQKLTLSDSEHTLGVNQGGRSWSGVFQMGGDAELTLGLYEHTREAPHRAVILSKPGNARVMVDGEPRGRTPWTGQIDAGKHTIKLRKKGFDEWVGRITPFSNFLLRGILTRTKSKDTPSPSEKVERLTKVMPSGGAPDDGMGNNLEKVMGGQSVQDYWETTGEETESNNLFTETASPMKKPGPASNVQESNSTNDSESTTAASDETPKKETTRRAAVKTVPLKIWSSPSGANVFINGEKVGQTPLIRANYPVGEAVIALDKDGYHRWQDNFELNRTTSLKINLKSETSR